MSPSIWTRCGARSNVRAFSARPWRVVEAQHVNATRKLVDTVEEQALLEELIETAKPPARNPAGVHYLLHTPFRYPPLRHGSRFSTRAEPSLWYGSKSLRSAFAENAYYRLVFLAGTRATLDPIELDVTAFQAQVRTRHGVDLTRPPFDSHRAHISSPTSYVESQRLGAEMRAAGVEAFRYASARDPDGLNVALFTPAAFGSTEPEKLQTWRSNVSAARVEFVARDFMAQESVVFLRDAFEVDGEIPAQAP